MLDVKTDEMTTWDVNDLDIIGIVQQTTSPGDFCCLEYLSLSDFITFFVYCKEVSMIVRFLLMASTTSRIQSFQPWQSCVQKEKIWWLPAFHSRLCQWTFSPKRCHSQVSQKSLPNRIENSLRIRQVMQGILNCYDSTDDAWKHLTYTNCYQAMVERQNRRISKFFV